MLHQEEPSSQRHLEPFNMLPQRLQVCDVVRRLGPCLFNIPAQPASRNSNPTLYLTVCSMIPQEAFPIMIALAKPWNPDFVCR